MKRWKQNEDRYSVFIESQEGEEMTKRWWMLILIGCFFMFPVLAEAQIGEVLDQFLQGGEKIRPEYLKVVQLEISPDPVREGQRMAFRAVVSNNSRHTGKVSLSIRDKDEIITEIKDVRIKPGDNEILFPESSYRFSRGDHCFTVEADIERTHRPIDVAQNFCARRTQAGWTLSNRGIGPLYVEDLQMYPDPAAPGQEIQFKVRLRNDGRPIRGNVLIQDRDQVVVQIENVAIPNGYSELRFPRSLYALQRFDTCFTVVVDFEKTPYPVDATRGFCAKPTGWTLAPGPKEHRGR
jgi:hypothetical protein